MKLHRQFVVAVSALAGWACIGAHSAYAVECKVDKKGVFPNGDVKVLLVRDASLTSAANFAIFRAPLAVNTDGAPTSYHPDDFKGEQLAINRIDNGIIIRRTGAGPKLTTQDKIAVFDRWRKSGTWQVPRGFTISWRNVIAADAKGQPCIFKSGEFAGYFGSLTALKNGLASNKAGECAVLDQLDLREVPATALRGGSANPLQGFGARKGDLVQAINPTSKVAVSAVIGDTGNAKRIGEGSVALNMQLLGKTAQPKTYLEAVRLDTGASAMIVVTFPGTRSFRLARPYSAANVSARVEEWAKEKYRSLDALNDTIAECAKKL